VLYEPGLMPVPRYPADHAGIPRELSAADLDRWAGLRRLAAIRSLCPDSDRRKRDGREDDGEDDQQRAKAAQASGRPVAIDLEERAAYLGVSAEERGRRLAALEAPDFTLPDLEGRPHSLSDHRGKKVFLVAYGSW